MRMKMVALIIGLVALAAFGQATKMSTIMANYTNYNIPIVTDNTIEINSIQALGGVEGNVDQTPTNLPLVLILVEPRLMNGFTGTKYQLADLQNRLIRFKRDLANEGKYGLVLSTTVYAGAVHQDGLTCMALRRFFKDVKANYPQLEGVIFVGRFPECSYVERLAWAYGGGIIKDNNGNVVQDFSNDGAILDINSGMTGPRSDIPIADLDGNWESRYHLSMTVEHCFIKPTDPNWQKWNQASFTVSGTKYAFQAGINPTYTDFFYVDDAVYSTPVINNGTISTTITTARPHSEVSATDKTRPSPMAMPDIFVSRINPYSAAFDEDLAWRDVNGKGLYDASGKPQTVATQPPGRIFSQDLERTLLVEYFDNNHFFRSGYYYNQPFNYGSAVHLTNTAASTSGTIVNARPDWAQEIDAPEYTINLTRLNVYADWLNKNVPFRILKAHANAYGNGFDDPDYNNMLTSAGDPHIWIPSGNVWSPSWTTNGGFAGFDFYHSVWKNKKISASISPSLVLNWGCQAATPVDKEATVSYVNYGPGQVSECLLFYGKTVGTIARSKDFNDHPDGWQSYTYSNPNAMFGDIWRKNFESLSANPNLWSAGSDFSAAKSPYWWVIFGDYTLKLRYAPCDGAQGGGDGFQGTAIGSAPSYAPGSEFCRATDGDISTFFDYSQGNGGYTGLDLGTAKVIGKIRFYPRPGWASRMVGGKFQGGNMTGNILTTVDLYTISGTPAEQWNEVAVSNSTAYRWVRYVSPDGGFCNIAEMEFYGPDVCFGAQGGGNGLRGTAFGLMPSWSAGSEYCKATDGDINTFFDYSHADGAYTGLDFGSAKVIGKIRFYPRIGLASRMVGGKFQGSNTSSSSGFVDLYTIPATPPEQWNEVAIPNFATYRWVRYQAPGNGYGNIAEMEFYPLGCSPYNGPHNIINGSTLELEDFDNGGEGYGYHDDDASNNGGAYRSTEGVDIEPCSAGGYNIGWIGMSEWTKYTCNVTGGTYDITLYYSSPNSVKYVLAQDDAFLATFSAPATGGWQNWQKVTLTNVPLKTGSSSVLKLTAAGSDFNVDKITFATSGMQYTITASAGSNGSISPSGSVTVNGGDSKTFTINPNPGFAIQNVQVDGKDKGEIDSYTFDNVADNHTISATFKYATYTITASAGTGGSIDPSGSVSVVGTSTQSFTITPNPGYVINTVFVDGSNMKAINQVTFTSVTTNHTISVTFAAADPCAGVQGGGSGFNGTTFGLNPPYAAGSEYCKATDGNINTFYDAQQADGAYTGLDLGTAKVIGKIRYYPRSGWGSRMTGGKFQGSNTSNSSGFVDLYTITSAPAVQWNEVAITNTTAYRWFRYVAPTGGYGNIAEMEFYAPVSQFTITASAGPNGTINPSGNVLVNYGSTPTFMITPNSGYDVSAVTVDGGSSQGAYTSYTFPPITSNHTIMATFVANTGVYEAEKAGLSGSAAVNTNHNGYLGTGFVDGFFNSTTARVSFYVNVPTAGSYTAKLRYSAGNGTSTNTGLSINGIVKTITCPGTSNWDTWADESETVTLSAGYNTIYYLVQSSSTSCINIDRLTLTAVPCTPPTIISSPVSTSICESSGNATMTVNASGATQYEWHDANGIITDSKYYTGTNTATLKFLYVPSAWNGTSYYCVVRNSAGCSATSSSAILTVYAAPAMNPIWNSSWYNHQGVGGNPNGNFWVQTDAPAGTTVYLTVTNSAYPQFNRTTQATGQSWPEVSAGNINLAAGTITVEYWCVNANGCQSPHLTWTNPAW